ncbi:UDP glucuronosyltransferase 5 family, polypeptide G1 [Corythoichthys intestinalis]|uniref:UDP glucuronosyltransferase 5 family, polypeptide G1 n=1 Tax=Corythoichthys intestinalis TaxID=161448 RepID=UPI0025A5EC51|nr:UDP glucuronosyltransferase 5 family, polypeptide G1 [Corythoichthys intestinalis]XP_061810561.1 UDP-glucuronosyltransferase 2C1-like [Nerophis lumbriciformis]
MSNVIVVFLAALGWLSQATQCAGSRILVVPLDGSHWINMEVILKELHSRGHKLTVLHSSNSWYIPSNSTFYTSITATMFEDGVKKDYYNQVLLDVMECRESAGFLRSFYQQRLLTNMLATGHKVLAEVAATMFDDPGFMKRLREAKFDLMLTDPGLTIGVLLGNYLKLPMVFNVRWINNGESHFAMAPSPISYVPVPGSELHDRMDFQERLKNMLLYIYSLIELYFYINPAYSDLFKRYFPPKTDLMTLEQAADIWLVRSDFVFEFPRPTMPNVVYIGGFQCEEARPLPADFEAFMRSSGEHGVVLMSLGTLVSALPRRVTESIAAAFAQLPQKVIWKFKGEKPSSLGDNTLLVDWLPQNDLLRHPKTRAFVAHGGTNGMYEAIFHGVPVLGLPLLFDQFDNLLRLKVRGGARVVEVNSLTKEGFLEALTDILETPTYRENMRRLSRLHRDRPMPPLESAIFWIEYVIRHKGASHLRPVAYDLPWYSYFCADVVLLIAAVVAIVAWALVFICKIVCCRRFGKKIKWE